MPNILPSGGQLSALSYQRDRTERILVRSIAWSNEHTTRESKEYLRSLLPNARLRLGELRVDLVHGSPRRINEYLYEDRPDSSLERLLDLAQAEVLVCGHTHMPYHRVLPSGRHVVNAGRPLIFLRMGRFGIVMS